jgi:hypothetical protein
MVQTLAPKGPSLGASENIQNIGNIHTFILGGFFANSLSIGTAHRRLANGQRAFDNANSKIEKRKASIDVVTTREASFYFCLVLFSGKKKIPLQPSPTVALPLGVSRIA